MGLFIFCFWIVDREEVLIILHQCLDEEYNRWAADDDHGEFNDEIHADKNRDQRAEETTKE